MMIPWTLFGQIVILMFVVGIVIDGVVNYKYKHGDKREDKQ